MWGEWGAMGMVHEVVVGWWWAVPSAMVRGHWWGPPVTRMVPWERGRVVRGEWGEGYRAVARVGGRRTHAVGRVEVIPEFAEVAWILL